MLSTSKNNRLGFADLTSDAEEEKSGPGFAEEEKTFPTSYFDDYDDEDGKIEPVTYEMNQ